MMSFIILALILNGAVAKNCGNLPQEVKNMRQGFDFYTFKSHPVPDTGDSKGIPVIKVTCDKNKTWINPLTQIEYDCPDQMNCDTIECNTGGSSGSITTTYTNSSDFEESVSISYSEDKSKLGGIVHTQTSKEYTDASGIYLFQKKIRSVAYVEVHQCTFQWNPLVELTLDDDALEFYEKNIGANTTFGPDTVEKFEDFFKLVPPELKFGIEYGGRAHATYDTNVDYLRTYHDTGVNVQAGGSFLNMISAKGGGGSSTHKVTDEFLDATTITTSWSGGKTDPVSGPEQYEEWAETVMSNPVAIKISSELPQGGNFEISDIVPKEGRDAMHTARINHNNVNALQNALDKLDKMTDKVNNKKGNSISGSNIIWPPPTCELDGSYFPSNFNDYATCQHPNTVGYPIESFVHTPSTAPNAGLCSCDNPITSALMADYTTKAQEAIEQVNKVEKMIDSTKTAINAALNKYNPPVVSEAEALALYAMFAETAYEVENDQQKTIECSAACGICNWAPGHGFVPSYIKCFTDGATQYYTANITAGVIGSVEHPRKFESYEKW